MSTPAATRPQPDLAITETRVYRGANVWSYDKAIHLVVDLGSLEDFPTNTLTGFTDELLQLLPGLREHSCSRGRRGGFVERLHEGTWLGHVAEHIALALQQVVGHGVRIDLEAALGDCLLDIGHARAVHHRGIGHAAFDRLQLRGERTELDAVATAGSGCAGSAFS